MITADLMVARAERNDLNYYLSRSCALLMTAGCTAFIVPAMTPGDEDQAFAAWVQRQGGETAADRALRVYSDGTRETGEREWRARFRANWDNEVHAAQWDAGRVVIVYTRPQAETAASLGATIRYDGRAILPTAADASAVAALCPVQHIGNCSYPLLNEAGDWAFLEDLHPGDAEIVAKHRAWATDEYARLGQIRQALEAELGPNAADRVSRPPFAPVNAARKRVGCSQQDVHAAFRETPESLTFRAMANAHAEIEHRWQEYAEQRRFANA